MTKRLVFRLINALWYSVALLIVLAAVLVTIGRETLPQVNLDNERLLNLMEQRTGAEIAADNLRLEWVRLYPQLRANRLQITTATVALDLQDASIDLDIPRTLATRQPVIDRLNVGHAHVRLQPGSGNADPAAMDSTAAWQLADSLASKNIFINQLAMEWQGTAGLRRLDMSELRLQNRLGRRKLFLQLQDGEQRLTVMGELGSGSLRDSTGKLYLHAEGLAPGAWLPATEQPWLAADWRVSGEAWLQWQGHASQQLIAEITVKRQGTDASITLPDAVTASLSGSREPGGALRLDIHTLSSQRNNTTDTWLEQARVTLHPHQPGQWRLQVAAVPLERSRQLLPYLGQDSLLHRMLTGLNLRGTLRNIDLQWDNARPLPERMRLLANADGLGSDAWHGIPAFTGVSGYVDSGIGYGFIDLASREGFSMLFPEVYRQALQFREAGGRVQWQWSAEEDTVLVGSDYAVLNGDMGQARGHFLLRLSIEEAQFPDELHLAIGLRQSEAKHRYALLPYTLPDDLLAWLDRSIHAGTVPAAGFFYRGHLSGHEPSTRAIQFHADVHDGALTFDPVWPGLTGLDATVLVDDGNTSVHASRGQMLDSQVSDLQVTVTPVDQGLLLGVRGNVRADTKNGLRLLRETPLHEAFGNAFDSWQSSKGQISAALAMHLPLGKASVAPRQDVRLAFLDTDLAMDDLRLTLSGLRGEMRYQDDKGLQADRMEARLFGQPVTLAIDSRKTPQDLTVTVKGKGQADIAQLARWSGLQPLLLAKGSATYDAAITLGPFSDTAAIDAALGQVVVTSDLRQVTLPLPAPLGKKAGERTTFRLTADLFRQQRQDYRFVLGQDALTGAFSVRNGALHGGEIAAGGLPARIPDGPAPLHIRGQLAEADLGQWLDLIDAYNRLPAPSTAAGSTSGDWPTVSVSAATATWQDQSVADLQLVANHENSRWQLYFDSSLARGSVFLHDNGNPPDIRLNELRLDRQPTTPADSTPANDRSSLNFADIPSMNLAIDRLIVDGMDVGSLSTRLQSRPDALVFRQVLVDGPGYRLRDIGGEQGAELTWRKGADGSERTEFRGQLRMQGQQQALAHLGVEPFVRGENILLGANLDWPGSPMAANINRLRGTLHTEGRNGKYLHASPNTAMRAISFINVATWARRLRLDFSDLGSEGISFDTYKGSLQFDEGIVRFTEPLRIASTSSELTLDGKAMLDSEQLDLRLTATLPVGSNATWIAAIAGGLPAAAGVYLVSKVFDNQIANITSLSYRITGPMEEPEVSFEKIAAPLATSRQPKKKD